MLAHDLLLNNLSNDEIKLGLFCHGCEKTYETLLLFWKHILPIWKIHNFEIATHGGCCDRDVNTQGLLWI